MFELDLNDLLARADQVYSPAEQFGIVRVIVVPGKTDREITLSVASETLSRLIDRVRLHEITVVRAHRVCHPCLPELGTGIRSRGGSTESLTSRSTFLRRRNRV